MPGTVVGVQNTLQKEEASAFEALVVWWTETGTRTRTSTEAGTGTMTAAQGTVEAPGKLLPISVRLPQAPSTQADAQSELIQRQLPLRAGSITVTPLPPARPVSPKAQVDT